jgi:dienelactone hydrolase
MQEKKDSPMSNKVLITARDGKAIYCTLNRATTNQAEQLVIIGHGLTGHINEYLHQFAYRHLTQAGYDVLRIAFYSDEDDARKLDECTVQIHANDLNDVIEFIRDDYSALFYAGHSYGGLTALLAAPDICATAFWDSSYIPTFLNDEVVQRPEEDLFYLNWSCKTLISKDRLREARSLNESIMLNKAASYPNPALILIAGGNTQDTAQGQKLYQDLGGTKDLHVVENADHCFNEGNTAQDALDNTVAWFRACSAPPLDTSEAT